MSTISAFSKQDLIELLVKNIFMINTSKNKAAVDELAEKEFLNYQKKDIEELRNIYMMNLDMGNIHPFVIAEIENQI